LAVAVVVELEAALGTGIREEAPGPEAFKDSRLVPVVVLEKEEEEAEVSCRWGWVRWLRR
jgi:hypothetical protein